MFTRRQIIRSGLLGASAIGGLPRLLQAKADKNSSHPLILRIVCDGGWDPTMVFDPKLNLATVDTQPGCQAASHGALTYIQHPSRPQVSQFFSNHAANSVILNGLYCHAADHTKARFNTLGIRNPEKEGQYLDLLAYYARKTAAHREIPYLLMNGPAMLGSETADTLQLDERILAKFLHPVPGGLSLGASAENLIQEHLELRLEDELTRKNPSTIDGEKLRAFHRHYIRQSQLANSLTSIRDQHINPGDSDTLRHAKYALHLFAQGKSQVASIRHGAKLAWDTHQNHFSTQSQLYDDLFQAMQEIIALATSLGIADRLMIVVSSELGRSAKLNQDGGKGHWPYTSAFVWGHNLKGGQVLGKTDAHLRGVPMDPIFGDYDTPTTENLTHYHLYAALFYIAGIDYGDLMPQQKLLSGVIDE